VFIAKGLAKNKFLVIDASFEPAQATLRPFEHKVNPQYGIYRSEIIGPN